MSIAAATQQILDNYEKVDVVLNNAGYGLAGPFEAATSEQIKRQFDTNLFGLMSVTRAFLPHFRANRAGLFVNVSSIGGRVTFPFISLYHSTKWAVEGFSEALSYELGALGIQVKIIEPGGVDTDFSGRSMDFGARDGLTDYNEFLSKFQASVGTGLGGSTAEQIAEAIYGAATDGKNQLRYLIGADAEKIYGLRQAYGDEAFLTGIKQQILS